MRFFHMQAAAADGYLRGNPFCVVLQKGILSGHPIREAGIVWGRYCCKMLLNEYLKTVAI